MFRFLFLLIGWGLCLGLEESSVPLLMGNLVEVRSVSPDIVVDLPYATTANFTNKKLYPEELCFLHRDAALALRAVQRDLSAYRLGLKIWDGYRPLSLGREMEKELTEVQHLKEPERHARGTAVNVTLVDQHQWELDRPPGPDIFIDRSHRNFQALSEEVIFHRILLEQVMERHGFMPHPRLWWHFDFRQYEAYPILDITLLDLVAEYHRLACENHMH